MRANRYRTKCLHADRMPQAAPTTRNRTVAPASSMEGDRVLRETGWPEGVWSMVRKEGLEPSRACAHRILNPARLPIPPLPHADRNA